MRDQELREGVTSRVSSRVYSGKSPRRQSEGSISYTVGGVVRTRVVGEIKGVTIIEVDIKSRNIIENLLRNPPNEKDLTRFA